MYRQGKFSGIINEKRGPKNIIFETSFPALSTQPGAHINVFF